LNCIVLFLFICLFLFYFILIIIIIISFLQAAGELGLTAICELCGKECAEDELRTHIRNAHEVGTFPCSTCGKVFEFKNILAAHMLSHTKPHVCEYCGKGFSTPSLLKEHVSYIHLGKVSALFLC
jgi:DNA-directed RNA polymerase subunit RPC12/RpoP